jgi:hypothetical protein
MMRVIVVLLVISFLLIVDLTFSYFFNPYHDEDGKNLNSIIIGPYVFRWDSVDPFLQINSHKDPSKILFRTLPSWPFVTIGYATDSNPPIVDGNYKVNEWTLFETPYQSITKVTVLDGVFFMSGEVWGLVTKAEYDMQFWLSDDKSQILFNLTARAILGTFNRLFLNYWCDPTETFHGFGVQV